MGSTQSEHVYGRTNPQVSNEGYKPYFGRVKRLTYNEIQARKDKGICFNCDETCKLGRKCKNK